MGGSVERTMANGGYVVMLNVTRQPDRGAVRAPHFWEGKSGTSAEGQPRPVHQNRTSAIGVAVQDVQRNRAG